MTTQLQTVLDALERYQTKRQDFDTFTEAIEIVRGMMSAEPVAYEFRMRDEYQVAADKLAAENLELRSKLEALRQAYGLMHGSSK